MAAKILGLRAAGRTVHRGSEAACRSQRKNFIFGNGWRRKELTVGLLLDGLTPDKGFQTPAYPKDALEASVLRSQH